MANAKKILVRRNILILFMLIIVLSGCVSRKHMLASLEERYNNGDILIVNDWALLQSEIFFNSHKNKIKVETVQTINKDSAMLNYGTGGKEHNVYNISASNFKLLNTEIFIDSKALKVLIPTDSTFYFINGAPCWKYRNAILLLNRKKIAEISIISPESAMKIWGLNMGKKGATMINTEKTLNNK